jgi:hypothetical protein
VEVFDPASTRVKGEDNVVQGLRKERTLGRRRRAKPRCNNSIRNGDLKEWLCLGNERISGRIIVRTVRIVKRTAGTSVRIRK